MNLDDIGRSRDSASPREQGLFHLVDLDRADSAPLPRRLAEVASWNLLVELVRRHPSKFWLRVTHPMEGLPYDCLQLCRLDRPSGYPFLEVNRTGVNARWALATGEQSVTPWTTAMGNRHEAEAWAAERAMEWGGPRLIDTTSPTREWILQRERDLGLTPPHGLPPSTPSSLALRWIAKFLSVNVGSEQPWYAYTGGRDLMDRLGDLHPNHREWRAEHVHDWQRDWIWLLIYGGEARARVALSAQGDLWTREQHFRLKSLHTSGAPITALLLHTVSDLLP